MRNLRWERTFGQRTGEPECEAEVLSGDEIVCCSCRASTEMRARLMSVGLSRLTTPDRAQQMASTRRETRESHPSCGTNLSVDTLDSRKTHMTT